MILKMKQSNIAVYMTVLLRCHLFENRITAQSPYERRREKTSILHMRKQRADQLRGYREADLRLCFRICNMLVFP